MVFMHDTVNAGSENLMKAGLMSDTDSERELLIYTGVDLTYLACDTSDG